MTRKLVGDIQGRTLGEVPFKLIGRIRPQRERECEKARSRQGDQFTPVPSQGDCKIPAIHGEL